MYNFNLYEAWDEMNEDDQATNNNSLTYNNVNDIPEEKWIDIKNYNLLPQEDGIYIIRIQNENNTFSYYVGQATDLRKRTGQHIGSQKKALLVDNEIKKALEAEPKRAVDIAILEQGIANSFMNNFNNNSKNEETNTIDTITAISNDKTSEVTEMVENVQKKFSSIDLTKTGADISTEEVREIYDSVFNIKMQTVKHILDKLEAKYIKQFNTYCNGLNQSRCAWRIQNGRYDERQINIYIKDI